MVDQDWCLRPVSEKPIVVETDRHALLRASHEHCAFLCVFSSHFSFSLPPLLFLRCQRLIGFHPCIPIAQLIDSLRLQTGLSSSRALYKRAQLKRFLSLISLLLTFLSCLIKLVKNDRKKVCGGSLGTMGELEYPLHFHTV